MSSTLICPYRAAYIRVPAGSCSIHPCSCWLVLLHASCQLDDRAFGAERLRAVGRGGSHGVRGFGAEVVVLGFVVLGVGFKILGLGFEVLGLGFEVLGLGFEVLVGSRLRGFDSRLQGSGSRLRWRQGLVNYQQFSKWTVEGPMPPCGARFLHIVGVCLFNI